MRIVGIGTDIVRISRLEHALDRFGEPFARRILSASEMGQYESAFRPANFLAKRFAAKEAAAKALGTGFRHGLRLRDIAVQNDASGKPELVFAGSAVQLARARRVDGCHLSLSDDGDYAVAFVTVTADR